MTTPDEMETHRERLLALRAEIDEQLASSADAARPVDLEEPIGRVSRVDAMQQQNMRSANRRAAQRRRQQIEAALRRMAEGTYGECTGCGEEIDARRLDALPESPMCVACQSSRER